MAATPNQPVPGNTMPAEINGDAQPMMHRGGTADKITAPMAAHGRRAGLRVQQRTHGTDKIAAAENHRTAASTGSDGQYAFETDITGTEARA